MTATQTPLTTVESIGRRTIGLAKTVEATAAAIIESVGADYDWTKRGAKPAAVHLFAVGSVDKADVPAQRKADKTPTDYGVGVDTLVHAITRALDTEPAETAASMRVSLTGVGSAVVPADHPAYALLLALLGADIEVE